MLKNMLLLCSAPPADLVQRCTYPASIRHASVCWAYQKHFHTSKRHCYDVLCGDGFFFLFLFASLLLSHTLGFTVPPKVAFVSSCFRMVFWWAYDPIGILALVELDSFFSCLLMLSLSHTHTHAHAIVTV